jgi:hypothetical protein
MYFFYLKKSQFMIVSQWSVSNVLYMGYVNLTLYFKVPSHQIWNRKKLVKPANKDQFINGRNFMVLCLYNYNQNKRQIETKTQTFSCQSINEESNYSFEKYKKG